MTTEPTASPEVWDPADYDDPRRRLVPHFDEFYGTAASLIDPGTERILDLGSGTGLMAAAAVAVAPGARLHLLDASEPMIAVARRRLAGRPLEVTIGDLSAPLPTGPFGAVVSALAIHHLDDRAKADLTARVFDVVAPGGVFVNAEQVSGPTAAVQARFEAMHEAWARAHGSDDAEWAAALGRMAHDRCATVDAQLGWMTAAGFVDVACWWSWGRFAVLGGRRPPG